MRIGRTQKNEKMRLRAEDSEYDLEMVTKYNYLKIPGRPNKGDRCKESLMHVIRLKNISKNVKKRIYKTIVRPMVGNIWM